MAAAGASISRIVLHGSRVYGRARPSSDFDILVVMRHEVRDWVAENVRLSGLFVDHDQPVDIQVFRKEEFEVCRPVPATIAYPADQDGLVLYDDRFPLEEEVLSKLPAGWRASQPAVRTRSASAPISLRSILGQFLSTESRESRTHGALRCTHPAVSPTRAAGPESR